VAKVLYGKEGFLFLAGDNNGVIDQHTGKKMLSKKQISSWVKTILQRTSLMADQECLFAMQIVPDKHSIYPDNLPIKTISDHKKNARTLEREIRPILGENLMVAADALDECKSQYLVFHKIDTHWNDRGAYAGYCQFMDWLKGKVPDVKAMAAPKYETKWFGGDLGAMLDLKLSSEAEVLIENTDYKEVFNNRVPVTGKIQVFENSNADNDLSLLIFGGSSTVNFLKFVRFSFKRVVFSWSGNFDRDLINLEKPDVVLNQIRERFLIRSANDATGINATEAAFIKGFKTGYYRNLWVGGITLRNILINCLSKIGQAENVAYAGDLKAISFLMGIAPLFEYAKSLGVQADNIAQIKDDIGERLGNLLDEIKTSEYYSDETLANNIKSLDKQPAYLDRDPVINYLFYGWLFDYTLTADFLGVEYLEKYQDVKSAGMHPLWHYERHGKLEGRSIH
jgi:alginate O-acetyltransferase complex protein AlgJ